MKTEQQRMNILRKKSLKDLTVVYNNLLDPRVKKIKALKCSKIEACKKILALELKTARAAAKDKEPSTVPGKTVGQIKKEVDKMVDKAIKEIKPAKAKVAKEKKATVGNLCKTLILAGKNIEEILSEVKKNFPQAKTSKACVSWYKSKMRKQGLIA